MISVVLLTKNGGSLLIPIVNRLRRQQLNDDWELIAVDSGSTDGSLEFLKQVCDKVVEVRVRQFLFGPMRELGFSKARGEIIVTLSQDVMPFGETFLADLTDPIRCDGFDVVQGRTIPPLDQSVFYWEKLDAFYFTGEGRLFFEAAKCIGGLSCTSMAIRRKAWEATGFGQTPFCEDKYIQARLQQKGYRIKYLDQPNAWHGHNYSLRMLTKRCYNEGVGWYHVPGKYTFSEFIYDLVIKPWRYVGAFVQGILTGQIRDLSSLLFFQIRPIFLFLGNRVFRRYWS